VIEKGLRTDVRPCNDWILVKCDPSDEISTGGLIIPEGAHEEVHEWGTVVRVGPGKFYEKLGERVPLEVAPGERVFYIKFLKRTHTGLSLVDVLGEGLFLIQQKDIIVAEEGERAT
jgi:chaperonin GroES